MNSMWEQLAIMLAKAAIQHGPEMYGEIKKLLRGDPSAPTIEDIDKRIKILKADPESYFGPRLVDEPEGSPV